MTTRYGITISYQTGDSFGSEDTTGEVGCSWTDINKAKAALQAIAEHYRLRDEFDRLPYTRQDEFMISIKDKSWYCDMEGSSYMWRHALKVEKDDGEMQQISAFWCGYFERLYSAEISVEGDTDMKVTF